MSANANFAGTPRTAVARIAAASTTPDASDGNSVLLITGGNNGTRVDTIQFKASSSAYGAYAGGLMRIHYSPDSGASKYLVKETLMGAATSSATVAGADVLIALGMYLPNNAAQFYVSASVIPGPASPKIEATASGGDF